MERCVLCLGHFAHLCSGREGLPTLERLPGLRGCLNPGRFSAVKTAEPASPSGRSEEDEAFSFPVTPPSEPAAPGAVFSSWHSFRKRRPSKVFLISVATVPSFLASLRVCGFVEHAPIALHGCECNHHLSGDVVLAGDSILWVRL